MLHNLWVAKRTNFTALMKNNANVDAVWPRSPCWNLWHRHMNLFIFCLFLYFSWPSSLTNGGFRPSSQRPRYVLIRTCPELDIAACRHYTPDKKCFFWVLSSTTPPSITYEQRDEWRMKWFTWGTLVGSNWLCHFCWPCFFLDFCGLRMKITIRFTHPWMNE